MSQYIENIFPGGISSQYKPAFDNAAQFWGNIIKKGHSGYRFTSQFNTKDCGVSHTFPAGHTVHGLAILSQVAPIDGPGKILGQAGPCYMFENFPFIGIMKFDSSDSQALLDSNQFGNVIKHEMGHVIGVGSLWQYHNLVRNPCQTKPCNTNPTYVGGYGIDGFKKLGGTGSLLVADENGPGTWNAHWREDEFDNELMTGFLNSAAPNPMSIMSIMSLMDMGYGVNLNAAEQYTLPNKLARPLGGVNFRLEAEMLEFDREDIRDVVARQERENGNQEAEYEILGLTAFMLIGFVMLAGAMFYSAMKQKRQIALLPTASRGRSIRENKK